MVDDRELELIEQQIDSVDKACIILETENRITNDEINNFDALIGHANKTIKHTEGGIELVERITNTKRSKIKSKIEGLIAECLQNVYGKQYGAEFDYSIKANRTNVNIYVTKNTPDGVVKRNINGIGGGVADTAALPLKLLVLLTPMGKGVIYLLDQQVFLFPGEELEVSMLVNQK